MKKFGLTAFLSAGHGINDLVAGFFLGSLLNLQMDNFRIALYLFIYNLLAFGGQYPVALWLEKRKNPRDALICATGMNVIAVVIFPVFPSAAIVVTGIASAIYHVAGGTVCAYNNRASNIGIFAAPGVAGLIAGGYLAYIGAGILLYLVIATVLFFVLMLKANIKERPIDIAEKQNLSIDRHDLIMILLLTVISLRSATWNIFQLVYENNYSWLAGIAVAAVIGKILGGWAADKVGWKLYAIISLISAAPLLTFCKHQFIPFCIGIGLLQSGIPATTSLLIASSRSTSRGIAMSFGVAIVAGAILMVEPLRTFANTPILMASSLILMTAAFWYSNIKNDKRLISHSPGVVLGRR